MKRIFTFLRDVHEIAEWIRLQRQLDRMKSDWRFLEWYGKDHNGGMALPLDSILASQGLEKTLYFWQEWQAQETLQ